MLARSLLLTVIAAAIACQSKSTAPPVARDAAETAPVDAHFPELSDVVPIDAPPGPATRDVRPQTEAFFAALGKSHELIWKAAHPEFQKTTRLARLDRTLTMMTAPIGDFQAISDFHAEAGPVAGDNVALGTARFAHATVRFQLTFRDDGDTPRLVYFNVDVPPDVLPKATPEQAKQLADQAVHSLLSGDFDAFRPFLHPSTDAGFGDEAADQLKKITASIGEVSAVHLETQEACKGGQCFVYLVTGAKAKAKADFTLTKLFGQWQVREFHLALE